MLAKKKKLSKKQIKEDKLVTSYYKAIKFYEEYQSKILVAASVIAAIVVVIIWYTNHIKENNLKATTEMARVIPIYESGSYKEAIDGRLGTNIMGFRKIIDEYGNTDQGELAKIYIANSYYFLGDFQSALKFYDEYSGSNTEFKAAALAGEASCYETMGNYEKAAEYYKGAAFVTKYNPLNPDYLLNASINFIKIGDNQEAKYLLNKIKSDYNSPQISRDADRYLARL